MWALEHVLLFLTSLDNTKLDNAKPYNLTHGAITSFACHFVEHPVKRMSNYHALLTSFRIEQAFLLPLLNQLRQLFPSQIFLATFSPKPHRNKPSSFHRQCVAPFLCLFAEVWKSANVWHNNNPYAYIL